MIRLRMRKSSEKEGCVVLEALQGVTHHGFGTFLEQIQPDEIDADQFSIDAVSNAGYSSSPTMGVDIYADPPAVFSWGREAHVVTMSVEEFCLHPEAMDWFKHVVPAK